jgi:hypothetical protein
MEFNTNWAIGNKRWNGTKQVVQYQLNLTPIEIRNSTSLKIFKNNAVDNNLLCV